jgi:hypothetical protein
LLLRVDDGRRRAAGCLLRRPWAELSPANKAALAPFFDGTSWIAAQAKWLGIAQRYPYPGQQERAKQQMGGRA